MIELLQESLAVLQKIPPITLDLDCEIGDLILKIDKFIKYQSSKDDTDLFKKLCAKADEEFVASNCMPPNVSDPQPWIWKQYKLSRKFSYSMCGVTCSGTFYVEFNYDFSKVINSWYTSNITINKESV
jgi:hypothetical protein